MIERKHEASGDLVGGDNIGQHQLALSCAASSKKAVARLMLAVRLRKHPRFAAFHYVDQARQTCLAEVVLSCAAQMFNAFSSPRVID